MTEAPRLPGLRPGSAAEDRSGQEQPLDTLPQQKSQYLVRLRRQRSVQALHRLGARATFEFINEMAERFGVESAVDDRLAAYAERLSPELLTTVGGDRFAPVPLRTVGAGR